MVYQLNIVTYTKRSKLPKTLSTSLNTASAVHLSNSPGTLPTIALYSLSLELIFAIQWYIFFRREECRLKRWHTNMLIGFVSLAPVCNEQVGRVALPILFDQEISQFFYDMQCWVDSHDVVRAVSFLYVELKWNVYLFLWNKKKLYALIHFTN